MKLRKKLFILYTVSLIAARLAAQSSIFEASGRVGIGAPPVLEKLEVSGGNVMITGTTNPYIMLKSNATGSPYGFLQFDATEGNYVRLFDGLDYTMTWRAGKVGIGTANPANALDVKSTGTSTAIGLLTTAYAADALRLINADGSLRISSGTSVNLLNLVGGNVGVGTTSPSVRLEVVGPAVIDPYWQSEGIRVSASGHSAGLGVDASSSHWGVSLFQDGAKRLTVDSNGGLLVGTAFVALNAPANGLCVEGNVGIGTINPTQKLSVNGTIRAKEVVVETTGWSDYVFADNYVLQPLSEVETHIKQNKHLPGIPSAQQVAESGVGLGEMQAKLLAKIEELTLHQIEQEKRLITQAEHAVAQDRRIQLLEDENRQLKTDRN